MLSLTYMSTILLFSIMWDFSLTPILWIKVKKKKSGLKLKSEN